MSTYITLAEAKTHLRVDFTDDDTYIQALCDLVEEVVANEIKGSTKGEGTISYTSGASGCTGYETNFMDYATGNTVTIDGYTTKYDMTIATITDNTHLTFTSAFGSTESGMEWIVNQGLPLIAGLLPLGLHHAMLLLLGHFYMVREPVVIGVNINKVPYAFDFLIAPFKLYTVA